MNGDEMLPHRHASCQGIATTSCAASATARPKFRTKTSSGHAHPLKSRGKERRGARNDNCSRFDTRRYITNENTSRHWCHAAHGILHVRANANARSVTTSRSPNRRREQSGNAARSVGANGGCSAWDAARKGSLSGLMNTIAMNDGTPTHTHTRLHTGAKRRVSFSGDRCRACAYGTEG